LAEPKKKSFQVLSAAPQKHDANATPFAITLGALKPGHIDDLIPFLSEIGLDELHVFMSEGVAKARLGRKQRERWQRIALQSIKQCKRPWALSIHAHAGLPEMLAQVSERFAARGVLDEHGQSLTASGADSLLLVCGGEKGFSASEAALLKNHG